MEKLELGKKILQHLAIYGYKGFFVGGSVRDYLLNKEINDIDIATDAYPEIVMKIFAKTIPTGLKHGTVTVLLEGVPFEVTTFRVEAGYKDYRRPDKVKFVSDLYEDLSRRDFTMNAMAMDINGQIIDPFAGRQAIKESKIAAVGKPEERFREDPLRMLRAVRFAAQLNFSIETATWKAIQNNSFNIQHIAVERIKIELAKIIAAEAADTGIKLLFSSSLLNWINGVKEIKITQSNYEKMIQILTQTNDPAVRWAIIFHHLNTDEQMAIMKALKFSNKEIKSITNLLNAVTILKANINENNLKKCLLMTNEAVCKKSIYLAYLLGYLNLNQKQQLIDQLFVISNELKVRKVSDLAITGKDLITYFKEEPGPWVKEILEKLFNEVIYNKFPNQRNYLLNKAIKLKEGKLDER